MFHFSTRKVGGLRIVKLGRLTLSFSVARKGTPFKPIKGAARSAAQTPITRPRGIPVYCVGEQA